MDKPNDHRSLCNKIGWSEAAQLPQLPPPVFVRHQVLNTINQLSLNNVINNAVIDINF